MTPIRVRTHLVITVEELEDRTVPTLLGQQLFPSDNPWNQKITDAPVASNSAAIISNIISVQKSDGRLHPDFGQDYRTGNTLYGIPYNVVHGNSQAKVHVVIDDYADESDVTDAPIPSGAVIEGDYDNRPNSNVAARGDSHLIVWDQDNNVLYEFYQASRPSENSDGRWHAAQETVWDMKTNTFRTLGWTSADAAGLPILPGLVRPDEALPVAQGGQGVINHAIRFTLQNAIILNQFLYPASHTANPGNTNPSIQPPMGARFRLKASVDISGLSPQAKIIAQAMKDYGMILADNGSNFFFTGASYAVDANNNFSLTWNDNDIQGTTAGLKSLHFSDFEVVDLTPRVTSLSATGGAAGDTVTITGQNFSGAAGRIQVLFGNKPATSVTVLDDAHVRAVVPSGSGTVNVRVQSGVTTTDARNINNPIFGYGISAINSNATFTYGTGGGTPSDSPPTVATPATASANPVTGTSVSLRALGADDGGEAALKYTWAAVSVPAGASPVFSANGSNAAKNTVVSFNRAGAYVFRVTITDAAGQSVTSSVSVSVLQTLSSLAIVPSSASIQGGSLQLQAVGFDQFGQSMALPRPVTWSLSGIGKISQTGLYTAPKKGRGTATVTAVLDGFRATAIIQVRKSLTQKRTARVRLLSLS